MHSNEKGFTLLETLFVLTIFTLIITFSFLLLKPHHLYTEKHLFFTQLKSDLLFAQQYAMSTQSRVTVNFHPAGYHYYCLNRNGEYIVYRKYSEKIIIREGTQSLYFTINEHGNLNRFGSLYVYIDDEPYRLTFLIGRGRFYVVKL